MVACEAGHGNVVELLLNRNAQIDHDDMAGSTALHFAIDGDTPQIVEHLISNGHDVGPRDFVAGWTPLMRLAGTLMCIVPQPCFASCEPLRKAR